MKKVVVKRKGNEIVSISATVEPIDYGKLAEAIVKAQKKSVAPTEVTGKTGFWRAIWAIVRNKEKQSGNKTALLLAEVMSYIFNVMAICALGVVLLIVYYSIFEYAWNMGTLQCVMHIGISLLLLGISLSMSLIFRGIANEIKAERDRNYIATLFFGFSSLVSCIVTLFVTI